MSSQSDEILSAQLRNPETRRRAFEAVVRQYGEQIYWQVRRIVLTHEDANDVVQNTFLKAWNALDDFHAASKLSTWLTRIALNESVDFTRRQKIRAAVSADIDPVVANNLLADQYFDGDETQALLQEAVASLPDAQRNVFLLRYFDEMPYEEISRVTGTSVSGLKSSYHHAVKKISDFFKARD